MSFTFVPSWDDKSRFICDIPTRDGKKKKFNVPLMTFIAKDVYKKFLEWAEEHPDQKLIDENKRPAEEAFNFLVKALEIEDHEYFTDELVFGEKNQLWEEWNRRSSLPLGESSASSES